MAEESNAEESNYAAKFILRLLLSVLFCAVIGVASFALFGIGVALIVVAVAVAVTIVPVITLGVGHAIEIEGKRNRDAMKEDHKEMMQDNQDVSDQAKASFRENRLKILETIKFPGSSAPTPVTGKELKSGGDSSSATPAEPGESGSSVQDTRQGAGKSATSEPADDPASISSTGKTR